MRTKINLRTGILLVAVFLISHLVFAQEGNVIKGPELEKGSSEPEVQWLWGEVLSVDPVNNQLKIKYIDFENDLEKEVLLYVDASTTFENVNSLAEIKPQDNLSIDYSVTADGKNVAKYIGLEKMETSAEMPEIVIEKTQEVPVPIKEPAAKTTSPGS